MSVKQKTPSDVYDDWKNTIESITMVYDNVLHNQIYPSWAENMSEIDLKNKIDNLKIENNCLYTLNMIASIEGFFNNQLVYFNRAKKWPGTLKRAFKSKINKKEYINFDNILDEWGKYDTRTKKRISDLKNFLNYRHWLAHGRHWKIHYWNIPDPEEVYILYSEINEIILFNLNL